jgi:hypothetical protein
VKISLSMLLYGLDLLKGKLIRFLPQQMFLVVLNTLQNGTFGTGQLHAGCTVEKAGSTFLLPWAFLSYFIKKVYQICWKNVLRSVC